MVRKRIENEYFDWMYQLAFSESPGKHFSYRRLLTYLHRKKFTYSIPMDGNRADDGINLRYRFGYEKKHTDAVVATLLDNDECSVLEMMVALALRCDEQIMYDSEVGERVGYWFWDMLISLHLDSMYDSKFDLDYTDKAIDILLDRKYRRNGEGGLFTVHQSGRDMRATEIWYQMCFYLNEKSDINEGQTERGEFYV